MKPPFDPASFPPGTTIADKYEIREVIGIGDVSVVYSAVHRLLQRKAAVKVLGPLDSLGERRFAREGRLAGSLRHPNVVEIYEVGRLPDGRPFLVMEHLEGVTLEQRRAERTRLAVIEALSIGRAVLSGLGAAHEKQIVHRDIRAENIFLARIRGEEVVKILDFGISREYGDGRDSTLTAPGTAIEGAAHLAPEQLYEGGVVDHRTDLYATGVLLYQLLTGRLPFTSKGASLLIDIVETTPEPPSRWREELPKDVDRVILMALAKQPRDRFEHAESMAEALRLASLFAQYLGPN